MTKTREICCVWSPHALLEIQCPCMHGLGFLCFAHKVLIFTNLYVPVSCVHYKFRRCMTYLRTVTTKKDFIEHRINAIKPSLGFKVCKAQLFQLLCFFVLARLLTLEFHSIFLCMFIQPVGQLIHGMQAADCASHLKTSTECVYRPLFGTLSFCSLHHVDPGSITGTIQLAFVVEKAALDLISLSEYSGYTWLVIFQRMFGVLPTNFRSRDNGNITGFSLQG